MDKVELKPCPFCGHPPVHRQIKNDGRWTTDCNTVTCIRPTTGICQTEVGATSAWNTRSSDDFLSGVKAGLEAGAKVADLYIRDVGDGDDTPLLEANATCKRISQAILSIDPAAVKDGQ